MQLALQKNAIKYNFVYTIDILISYEEYILEKTDTVNIRLLTKEQGKKFIALLEEFADLFAKDISELGRTNLIQHRIYTEDVPPIKSRSYNVPQNEQEFIKKEIGKILESKII